MREKAAVDGGTCGCWVGPTGGVQQPRTYAAVAPKCCLGRRMALVVSNDRASKMWGSSFSPLGLLEKSL